MVRVLHCHGAVAQDSRRFHDCFHALARIDLPISGALAPSNAQHGTRSITGYFVAEIPQAAQGTGLRTSSNHEHIRSQSAGSLGRRVSNRADGDADERMRTSGALQLLDPAACCSPFRRLQSLLQIQFNRQIGPARGNHVTESTRGLFIEPIPRTLNSHLLFGCLHLGAHERI